MNVNKLPHDFSWRFPKTPHKNGCTVSPLDGRYGNLSGTGVRITKEIAGTDRTLSHILQIYKGGFLSNTSAIRCCDALLIEHPKFTSS